jgi:hypothetical protein
MSIKEQVINDFEIMIEDCVSMCWPSRECIHDSENVTTVVLASLAKARGCLQMTHGLAVFDFKTNVQGPLWQIGIF